MQKFSSASPIIEAIKLEKKIKSTSGDTISILNNLDLNVKMQETVAITGSSGCGKTTLLTLLAGLDTCSSGVIKINNIELNNLTQNQLAKLRRDNISFIFQDFQLLDNLTALENVSLALELKEEKDAKIKAVNYLEKVGLQKRLKHYPKQLSGGEQQRVAIARAFVTEPKILLADEPTGNLDEITTTSIIKLLFDLHRQIENTLIVVTHDILVANCCETKYKLEQGLLHVI